MTPCISVDEDEESLEWEREQLRRGGHDARASEPTLVKQIYKAAQSIPIIQLFYSTAAYIFPVPPATDIPALGPAIERFQRSLVSLSDSHALSTGAITSLAEQRTELDTRETELRSMIADAESKRGWFAEFRDWVESVATFLDEKVSSSFLMPSNANLTSTVPQTRKARRGISFGAERTSRDDRAAAQRR